MKTFKQIVENIVVLDEAVMDQKMWDRTKKGDKLTISYDSGIKKGNKTTFVVGTKNIVGKAKVGKITMKREDGKGGKFFLYNRNGNISLALGDMAASMTGLVKESVEVELDEGAKTHFVFQKGVPDSKAKVHVGTEQSSKDWIKKNSKHFIHKGKDFVIFKGKYGKVRSKDRLDFKYVAETVELDERNYAKEYANYHSKPEQIANRSSRNKARRIMAKENDVDGMDVGHADNNPLNNDPANLRIENPSDNRREPRMRNEGKNDKYPLYHKDFSGAMKTAYDHAKKNLGVIVDPSEIDDKVAMGPKKPSTGKTNSYRLTDKSGKKAIQVQVYNTGKSYELNMYKEDLDEAVELDEAFKAGGLKLKDGKQVMVKKDDAMMLNDLMKQLSKPNVKKMTDTAMKNKKGYEEILGFARDSHE